MISIIDKKDCCGCSACVQRCPKQCITMHEDEEGFLYPKVDTETCIDCGLCEKVCPVLNSAEGKEPLAVYAAKNPNEEKRLASSSGGIFIALAEETIRQGGVVFGARFDADWNVVHAYAETEEELKPLMRSKYVQSSIGNTYKEAEEFLRQGRKVLFSGTPCQIKGLKCFLRQDYDNLLAVDIICHGVPSPGVWRKYLDEIRQAERSEAAGKNSVLSSSLKSMPVITDINFREKQNGGYSWQKFGFVVRGKSPSKGDQNTVLLSSIFSENPFMVGFLRNLYLRPSCYHCCSKGGRSNSDLTIGDYWGIESVAPEAYDKTGVSAVAVNSAKVERLLGTLGFDLIPTSYKQLCQFNPSLVVSSISDKRRAAFFHEFRQKGGKAIEKYGKMFAPPLLLRIKIQVARWLKIIRKS